MSWDKGTQCLNTWPACRWIGNAAEDGKMGTVFARLKVPSPDGSGALDDHGVHAFIVPLRDDSGNNMPGVEIRDCGYKVGQRCLSVAANLGSGWYRAHLLKKN